MRTPLNYTGNKSRLVTGFKEKFPTDIGIFVDLFCGGGTVGLSVDAEKIIFIDNNENVIALLKHLSRYRFETLINRLERLVELYGLSYSAKYGYSGYRQGIERGDNNGLKKFNSEAFYQMRSDYNSSDDKFSKDSLDLLYLLIVYAFNNDMRFNAKGEFNLPIGKTDLNKKNLQRLEDYIQRVNSIDCEFICGDFRDQNIEDILFSTDFIYADPPYLLGAAVYNENGKWNEESEKDLLDLFEKLKDKGKYFALSNVIEKSNPKCINRLLSSWVSGREDINIFDIDYHYRSSSYNKLNRNAQEREVLITNF